MELLDWQGSNGRVDDIWWLIQLVDTREDNYCSTFDKSNENVEAVEEDEEPTNGGGGDKGGEFAEAMEKGF